MLEESVRMIATSGDLLLSVVNDVLDYSKLESGNFDPTVTISSLQNTLSSILHSIQMKKKRSQQLRTFYGVDVPEWIHMDSRRLQQVRPALNFSRSFCAHLYLDSTRFSLICWGMQSNSLLKMV